MSTTAHLLSPDTQAILLLCGRFGQSRDAGIPPLSVSEYDRLAQWLLERGLRPADLLDTAWPAGTPDASLSIEITRLLALLDRGAALALVVESWANKGLWVVGRSDDTYPRRLKARLGRLAPPLLYGVGEIGLLSSGGLAVVGSRDADEIALAATRHVAETCSRQGIPIVSGGARGVDSEAMLAAVESGGQAVGILADSLARAAVAGKYRRALLAGNLALASPYDPESGFNVGNAMGRNKYIYALADWGLVISAALGKGGTWTGAVEVLKQQTPPLFVWVTDTPSAGNTGLLTQGAHPFPPEPWQDLAALLTQAATSMPRPQETQIALLSKNGTPLQHQRGATPTTSPTELPAEQAQVSQAPATTPPQLPCGVFEAVLPLLLSHLEQPRDIVTLAGLLDVRQGQLQDWLERAIAEGRVAKIAKPVRFVAVRHAQTALDFEGLVAS